MTENKTGPTQTARTVLDDRRWAASTGIARAIKVSLFLAPFVVSIALSWWASRRFPPARLGLNHWVWWITLIVAATVVVRVVEKLLSRFAPLSMLFKLSLVFPDEAPSRFAAALRSGSPRAVQRRLDDAKESGKTFDENDSYSQQMLDLVSMLSAHDRMTRGHAERVRAYSELIGEEMGLDAEELEKLRWSALLHDMGKLDVPAEILNKPGRPSKEEWAILQEHPAGAEKYLAPLARWLGDWRHAATGHHERWDGSGYPAGLAEEEIHLSARIVSVADAFDVMTSTRSYKQPLSVELGRQEVADKAGTQFDPAVARAFLRVGLGDLRRTAGPLAWLSGAPGIQNIPIGSVASSAQSLAVGVNAVAIGATALISGIGPGEAPEPRFEEPPAVVAFVDDPDFTLETEQLLEDTEGNLVVRVAGDNPTSVSIRFIGEPQATLETSSDESGLVHTVRVDPSENYSGPIPLTLEVCFDDGRCTNRSTVIDVAPINDPFSVSFGDYLVDEGQRITLRLVNAPDETPFSGDWPNGDRSIYTDDVDGDEVRVVSIESATGGTATRTGQSISFVHDALSVGTPTVSAIFSDGAITRQETFSINVNPLNDAPTLEPLAAASLAENLPAGTSIGLAESADQDGDRITYRLSPNNDAISIDSVTGEVTTKRPLDFEAEPQIQVTVVATDPSEASVSTEFVVTVVDVNESPVFPSPPVLTTSENSPVSTVIGKVTAVDPEGTATTHELDDDSLFAIDPSTGVITLVGRPAGATYPVTVIATDSTGLTNSTTVSIVVTGVNHAPTFTGPQPTLQVREDALVGEVIDVASATDPDGDSLTFSLVGANQSVLAVESDTGQLTLTTLLDFEADDAHLVTVRVVDNGSPVLADSRRLRIEVTDVNESPVIFSTADFDLPEVSAAVGSVLGIITATDPESGIIPVVATDATGSVSLAPDGTLSLIAPLDFETHPTITVELEAVDPLGLTSQQTLTISVIDENEAPEFISPNAATSVDEDAAPGTSLLPIEVSDPDSDSLTTRIISGNGAGFFEWTGGQLRLSPTAALDFEGTPTYLLTIGVSDGALETTTTVTVTVDPIDEAPDVVAGPLSFGEGTINPTVGTITATDQENETLTYMIGDPRFAIDGNGLVTVVDSTDFDFESDPETYNTTITVTDEADPDSQTTTVPVTITLLDVNEAPEFAVPNDTFFVDEGTAPGASLGQIAVSDPDGDGLTSRIVSGNDAGFFAWVGGELWLTPTAVLDFETTPSYALTIGASDGLIETQTLLTIHVDEVDEPPVISGPVSLTIPETQTAGPIGTFNAVDPETDAFTFGIRSGNDDSIFAINPTTGVLRIATELDFETTTSHTLEIHATQDDDPTLETTMNITITVDPIDEMPDAVAGPLSFAEGTVDPVVGTVTATDQEGETLTYSIADARFVIDANGQVTVVDSTSFDFETDPGSYNTTITVTDEADPDIQTTTTPVTISLLNANEEPSLGTGQSFTVVEDQTNGPIHATALTTTDPDVGDTIATWAIVGGNGDGSFSITNGVISKVGPLDFNAIQRHNLTVEITDVGGLTDTAVVTIDVSSRFGPNPSPFFGSLVINEVLFRDSGTVSDAIEFTNRGETLVDVTGWTIRNHDGTGTNPSDFAQLLDAFGTIAPGEHLSLSLPSGPLGDNDDLFLTDNNGLLVAYVGWGTSALIAPEQRPPLDVWPVWDPTFELDLTTNTAQSISLSPAGGNAAESACWEPTATGESIARCSGAVQTRDTATADPAEVSSLSQANTALVGLLISEVSTEGISGADFVEIYNASNSAIPLGGLRLDTFKDGSPEFSVDLSTGFLVLQPGQHFLVAEAGSSLAATADATIDHIHDRFGAGIFDGWAYLDAVGNAAGDGIGDGGLFEGNGVVLANPDSSFEQSYERLTGYGAGNCVDSDNNAADFFVNFAPGAINPQSTGDPIEPCATLGSPPGPSNAVRINELRTKGPLSARDEFIEVFNPKPTAEPMLGYEIVSSEGNEYTFGAVTLNPGEHFLLSGQDFPIVGDDAIGALDSTMTWMELRDDLGNVVHRIDIDSGPGSLPKTTNNVDATLQRRFAGCSDFANEIDNWTLSGTPTPTRQNGLDSPC